MLVLLLTFMFFGVLLGVGIFMARSRRQAIAVRPVPASGGHNRLSERAISNFHAVSICLDPSPCHSVRQLAGQRILSKEAPILPLPDCDQPNCACRFEHYTDRRAQQNRRDALVALGRLSAVPAEESVEERRSWRDRRAAGRA
jgi:hypothetical protein